MIYGYARVSTKDQKLNSQIDLLKNAGCDQIFTDVASGVREDRTGLNDLLEKVGPGDTVMVFKNDRIFRSLKQMVILIDKFKEKEVNFKSLTDPYFDTTTANGRFLLQIFSAVAEFERSLITERTKVGLDSARRRKVKLGRPRGPKEKTIEKYEVAKHFFKNKGIAIDKSCKMAKISKTTYYRVEEFLKKNTNKPGNDKKTGERV
jgi:DNA invertase Pin-like site-specific DNA recombinase